VARDQENQPARTVARPDRPDELLQDVPADEAFVFARNAKPLRCGRAIYFRRSALRDVIGDTRLQAARAPGDGPPDR